MRSSLLVVCTLAIWLILDASLALSAKPPPFVEGLRMTQSGWNGKEWIASIQPNYGPFANRNVAAMAGKGPASVLRFAQGGAAYDVQSVTRQKVVLFNQQTKKVIELSLTPSSDAPSR